MGAEDRQSGAAAAAEKVRAILEAAERETETQLKRVGDTAERLAARADEIETRLEELAGEVRSAIHELREELRGLRDLRPSEQPVRAEEDELVEELPPPLSEEPEIEVREESAPGAGAPGSEGARVIALNMALGGSSREETAAYLAENFELEDPEGLLDEVYERAGSG